MNRQGNCVYNSNHGGFMQEDSGSLPASEQYVKEIGKEKMKIKPSKYVQM